MVDFLDDILDEFTTDEGEEGVEPKVDIKAIQEEMAGLKKERNGLLKGMKDERSRRQEMTGRLNQLQETVNSVLTQRQQAAKDIEEVGQPASDKLPVQWTEDGDGYIPRDALNDITSQYEERIDNLERMLQNSTAQTTAVNEAQQVKDAIVGEDERYTDAHRRYQAARKWATDQVAEFSTARNVGRPLTSGEALDYVFDPDTEAVFTDKFPGLDLEAIVTAEDSQRHFRRALNTIADATTPTAADQDAERQNQGRFQRIMSKPAGLGNSANAKGNDMSVTQKLAGLSPLDIMNISDGQAEAIEKAMLEEEAGGGVDFNSNNKW